QFLFEVVEEQARAGPHDGVGRHQLRMREALVDVLVDDVGLIQNEVALHEDRNLPVRIHDGNVFRLVVQVDVTDFEIHAFFEQDKAAALGERASRSRIEHHHVAVSNRRGMNKGTPFGRSRKGKRRIRVRLVALPAALPAAWAAGKGSNLGCKDYFTSFQKTAFRRHATPKNRNRNSSTHTPRRLRSSCTGSAIHPRKLARSATWLSNCAAALGSTGVKVTLSEALPE